MKLSRVFVSGLLVVGALLGASTSVKSDVYCNSYGRCTGTNNAGQSVNTYTNSYGRTTGTIGNESVNLYENSYGRTTGSIGNDSVNTYTNSYGRTSC